ncbi:MAG TPA: glycosyltransferase family 1 protein [Devosiaceae bacterium]
MTRVLIVTDAWHPQTNGVVHSLGAIGRELSRRGIDVRYLTPEPFWTMPVPTYPEIRLSLPPMGRVAAFIEEFDPDHVHIATEGSLGLMARLCCSGQGLAFTTSYHTRFPEYVAARVPLPAEWSYAYLRWFHSAAARTMVPTASVAEDLRRRGFERLALWSRGVDAKRFRPGTKSWFTDLPGPHLLYVGRVSVEKNLPAFLALDVPGTRIIVGDGPQVEYLRRRFPEAVFLGRRTGVELAEIYRSADVFVFPSRTDTFGNVMIEALASGVPVAAFPVAGPVDVITDPAAGTMNEDLGAAIATALTLDRAAARHLALSFTWEASGDQFLSGLVPARTAERHRAA